VHPVAAGCAWPFSGHVSDRGTIFSWQPSLLSMLFQDDVRVVRGVVSQECLHRDVLCLWWTCNVPYRPVVLPAYCDRQETARILLANPKYRNWRAQHAFFEGQKAEQTSPRKSPPRTLKGVDQQYPPVKWSSLKVSRNTPLWCTPTQYRYLSHKNLSLSPCGHCTA
jgi:hypothetical protein